MSENTVELTAQNFEAEVIHSDRPVVVDFWAAWCAPCRMIAPIVDEVATQYDGRVKVGKLNVDEHSEIAARFNVRGIPTLLVFSDGKVREQMVGASSKDSVVRMIEKVMPADDVVV